MTHPHSSLSTPSTSPTSSFYYYRCSLPSQAPSSSTSTSWTHFRTKLVAELSAPHEHPAPVTLLDPDAAPSACHVERSSDDLMAGEPRHQHGTQTNVKAGGKCFSKNGWRHLKKTRHASSLKKQELELCHIVPKNGSILLKIEIHWNEVPLKLSAPRLERLKQQIHSHLSTSVLTFLHHGVNSIVNLDEPGNIVDQPSFTSSSSPIDPTLLDKKQAKKKEPMYSTTFQFHFCSSMYFVPSYLFPRPPSPSTTSLSPLLQLHSLTLMVYVRLNDVSCQPSLNPVLDSISFQHDWDPYFRGLLDHCVLLFPSLFSSTYIQSLKQSSQYLTSMLTSMYRITQRSESFKLHPLRMAWCDVETKYYQDVYVREKPKRTRGCSSTLIMSSATRTPAFEEDVFEEVGFEDLFPTNDAPTLSPLLPLPSLSYPLMFSPSSQTPTSTPIPLAFANLVDNKENEDEQALFDEDLFSLVGSSKHQIGESLSDLQDPIDLLLHRVHATGNQRQLVFHTLNQE